MQLKMEVTKEHLTKTQVSLVPDVLPGVKSTGEAKRPILSNTCTDIGLLPSSKQLYVVLPGPAPLTTL